MLRRTLPALAVLACAILAPAAPASTTQELLVEDDHRLLELSRPEQQHALDQLKSLGVDRIRAAIWWRPMVNGASQKQRPRGNPTDPGSPLYRSDGWEMVDSLVRGAHARGIELILNPTAASGLSGTIYQIPRWAQLRSHAPDPLEFRQFVRAVGRRYNGHYRPGAGGEPLPAVDDWSIWNEPNNAQFLRPQWKRQGDEWLPWSPVLYRDLYRTAASSLRASGHRSDRIYFGETAATGGGRRGPLASMAPAMFVREVACVGEDLSPYSGAAARVRACQHYKPLRTSGLTTHLYSPDSGSAPALALSADPDHWIPSDPGRPAELLEGLSAAGRLPASLDLMNTEAGFQSHPSLPSSLSQAEQALNTNLAEYLQYHDPAVDSFAQYLLTDDPVWFTGLRYIDGRAKQAFTAFRMPLVARRTLPNALGLGQVVIWGASYGRQAGRRVEILRDGILAGSVRPQNVRGYFEVVVPEPQVGAVYELRDPGTGIKSRRAVVTPGI